MVHFIPPSHRRLAMLAAQADSAPALICGASGTGKGAIAQWIHANSPRAARPLITAERDRTLAQQLPAAQGGTLLVPEIGEWPLAEQKTLASFLKTHAVRHPSSPIDGEATQLLLNVRIIATTDQSLEGRAQGGLFNVDLLEKLNVFRIEMPPLVKRQDEFEDIVLGVMGEITRELHKEHLRGLSPDAWVELRTYEWPGNIRELRNVLRLAVIAASGDRIEAQDLPAFGHDRVDFRATRERFEKTYIAELLKTFEWDIDLTCRLARMDRKTLLSKMKDYGIPDHPEAVHSG
jgi:DNA-binding NtrC family response regulator